MGHSWYDVLVVLLLVAAFVIPRTFARPDRHAWQVWLPACVAVAAVVYGASTRDWIFTAAFAVVLVIEVWRTWPVWSRLSATRRD